MLRNKLGSREMYKEWLVRVWSTHFIVKVQQVKWRYEDAGKHYFPFPPYTPMKVVETTYLNYLHSKIYHKDHDV